MKFLITGGGTGGHLAIAKALAEAFVSRGHEVIFVGSTSGQDRMWFEGPSVFSHTFFLQTTGVVNQKGFAKLKALWRIFRAFLEARKILKQHRIDGVFSVGGFSAAPASLAAISRFTPLFIHEQNAVTGRLNKILKPFARAFFSSYDAASPVHDYPVAPLLFEKARIRSKVKTLIFLGGSQGAKFINDLALRLAPELTRKGIAIIHQCGERDFSRVEAAYATLGVNAELYGFTRELPALLERSDLAVSRAGASTLWELCANALPAFYIPYPYAAADHQYYNARFIVEKKLGWSEREGADISALLLEVVDEAMEEKSRGLQQLVKSDGAEAIVKNVERMLT